MFALFGKALSAIQERQKDLEFKKNVQWSEGSEYNNLPKEFVLSYSFEEKKMAFTIEGGHERSNVITFSAADKTFYDEFSSTFGNQKVVDISTTPIPSLPDYSTFIFFYSTTEDVEFFINELNARAPFPDKVKKDLLAASEKLITAKKEAINPIESLENEKEPQREESAKPEKSRFKDIKEQIREVRAQVEDIREKANELKNKFADLQTELNELVKARKVDDLKIESISTFRP